MNGNNFTIFFEGMFHYIKHSLSNYIGIFGEVTGVDVVHDSVLVSTSAWHAGTP